MRITRVMLLAGAALWVGVPCVLADDLSALKSDLQTLDTRTLALEAAPVIPNSSLIVIGKTAQPQVPGLPLTAREKAAFGDKANTIRLLPSSDAPGSPTISWSGYARTGVIYQGGN